MTPFKSHHISHISSTSLGRGVLILVRQRLYPTLIPSNPAVEQVWVKLSLGDHALYVGGAYIPPRSENTVYSRLVDSCTGVADRLDDYDEMLLMCDLNLPEIEWHEDDEHLGAFLPVNVASESETIIGDGLMGIGCHQLNNMANTYGNVLETVFCTGLDKV